MGTADTRERGGWFGSHSNMEFSETRLYLAYQHLVLQLATGEHLKSHQ